jgi:phosphoribosylaminoimidazolecarboxamide formyltransferase/IMP cyclohydrolase
MALAVSEIFTEVIVAPSFDNDALDVLKEKASIRILEVVAPTGEIHSEMRPISGGMLLQSQDKFQSVGDKSSSWKLVSGTAADPKILADLEMK